MPNLGDEMEDHFFHAFELQLFVMGGDFDLARLAALKLETGSFEVPPVAEPYVAALRIAAGDVARAASIREMAAATAEIASACGGCHQATGGGPTDTMTPPQEAPHMALHVYAAYWMGYGLLAPDERAWIRGAEVLATAPLDASVAPPENPEAEAAVHALAVRAGTTEGWPARATLWGEILAECASCHRQVVH
jgi:cytochrome c553